jgi:hypothetical protein
MGENWDYLIVLDACRYDYFSTIWKDYFHGSLEKRLSVGSSTPEWCTGSFPDSYADVTYVSANPYINSGAEVGGFNGKRHFHRIIDVWDFGWDRELGTVPPGNVNEATLRLLEEPGERRVIVHYLQPHAPYLSGRFRAHGFPGQKAVDGGVLRGIEGYRGDAGIERLANVIGHLLSEPARTKLMNRWQLREIMRLPPASPMDAVRRKYGVDGLKEAYRENLKIVLGYAADLCRNILVQYPSKEIVICSDHGEFLGERNCYSHERGIVDPILLGIPWLVVTAVSRTQHAAGLDRLLA